MAAKNWNQKGSIMAPATSVTLLDALKSDTVDLAQPIRGFSLGVAGDIAIITLDGQSVVIAGLGAGTIHPVGAKRILTTGTTATGIVGYA